MDSRARGIGLARQLDDEAAAAGHLHHRLHGTELVDARAHHALGAADGVGAVGDDAARLIELEREVNAAPQVEPQLDRHAAEGGVAHLTRCASRRRAA